MSEFEIQNLVYENIFRNDKSVEAVFTNVNLYGWEMDILVLYRVGYTYEIEIKREEMDFLRDMKKKKHRVLNSRKIKRKPNFFTYLIPEGSGLVWVPKRYGIACYTEKSFIPKKESKPLSSEKIAISDKIKLYRKNYFKYWKLRTK